MQINIQKRHLFLIFSVITLLAGIILVASYTQPIPNPGHGGDKVWISVAGTEMSLQDAIDQNKFGGAGAKPTISSLYTVYGYNAATSNLGIHDVCLSAGQMLYDSAGDQNTKGCKAYMNSTNGWIVQSIGLVNHNDITCFYYCLDWS